MCGSNPELSPEVNSAKCIGGTALGFAIVTLIGFAIVPWGLVSALAGLFGVIAGSIVCCCGPKAKGEGDGKLNAAGILFIIALYLSSAVVHVNRALELLFRFYYRSSAHCLVFFWSRRAVSTFRASKS